MECKRSNALSLRRRVLRHERILQPAASSPIGLPDSAATLVRSCRYGKLAACLAICSLYSKRGSQPTALIDLTPAPLQSATQCRVSLSGLLNSVMVKRSDSGVGFLDGVPIGASCSYILSGKHYGKRGWRHFESSFFIASMSIANLFEQSGTTYILPISTPPWSRPGLSFEPSLQGNPRWLASASWRTA
jgi:hypothetical protein